MPRVLHSANLRYFSLNEDDTICGLGLLEVDLLALPTSDHSTTFPVNPFLTPLFKMVSLELGTTCTLSNNMFCHCLFLEWDHLTVIFLSMSLTGCVPQCLACSRYPIFVG